MMCVISVYKQDLTVQKDVVVSGYTQYMAVTQQGSCSL